MLKFYGYKKCGTCRKAEKALSEMNVAYEFIDITLNPPPKTVLAKIIRQSGLPAKKAFNTSGVQYKSEGWKDKLKGLTDNEMVAVLVGQGKLMKRPMVTDSTKSTIGYQEDHFAATWRQ